jgi:WS/DGAT/MGAT family acyltransferase
LFALEQAITMDQAAHYERLSPQDRSFLVFDGPTTPMHVSAVLLLEDRLPRTPDGAIDIGLIRRYVDARLHLLPRYRQRLLFTPLMRYPVWVDDARFDVRYHVRHTSLPRPGSVAQLHHLTSRLMSQPMDQQRPMWELWIIEGLTGDRVALVIKAHHSVVDGASGVEFLTVLLSASAEQPEIPQQRWHPRPQPSTLELLADDIRHQADLPRTAVRALKQLTAHPQKVPYEIADLWSGVRDSLAVALRPADHTPLNRPVGSARRVSWSRLDLDTVKAIKNRLDGSVNDVMVAAVTGALRHLLQRRRVELDGLHLRATIPVNVRRAAERDTAGNHVSAWLVDLPIRERDPLYRYAKVTALTKRMKQSSQARVIELLTDAAAGFDPLFTLGVRMAAYLSPYTLIISNVAGPSFPLYFLGGRLLEAYPFAPLFHNQGLAVGIFSYAGQVFVGCNADWDTVPDVDAFAAAIPRAVRELHTAATPARRARSHSARQIKVAAHA